MKNREIYGLNVSLNNLGNLQGVRFAYAVSRNINMLKHEIELIDKLTQPSKEFTEYEQERVKLNIEFAEKDDKDQPKTVDGHYVINDMKAFKKAMEGVQKKHKKTIDEREKQLADFNKFLEDESTFVPYKVKMANVPENITAQQLSSVFAIIDDTEYEGQ